MMSEGGGWQMVRWKFKRVHCGDGIGLQAECFYWELVVVCKKMSLIIIVVFAKDYPMFQMFGGLWVIFISMCPSVFHTVNVFSFVKHSFAAAFETESPKVTQRGNAWISKNM